MRQHTENKAKQILPKIPYYLILETFFHRFSLLFTEYSDNWIWSTGHKNCGPLAPVKLFGLSLNCARVVEYSFYYAGLTIPNNKVLNIDGAKCRHPGKMHLFAQHYYESHRGSRLPKKWKSPTRHGLWGHRARWLEVKSCYNYYDAVPTDIQTFVFYVSVQNMRTGKVHP